MIDERRHMTQQQYYFGLSILYEMMMCMNIFHSDDSVIEYMYRFVLSPSILGRQQKLLKRGR